MCRFDGNPEAFELRGFLLAPDCTEGRVFGQPFFSACEARLQRKCVGTDGTPGP